jgi:hypothetical protein
LIKPNGRFGFPNRPFRYCTPFINKIAYRD